MKATYVFALTVRFDPAAGSVEPERLELRYRRPAPPPGDPGWLFFRDHCWRGECNDPEHVRDLFADDVGLPVESVELRAFETDEAYLDALREAIADDLEAFRAESPREVLHKYLGSRLEVQSD